MAVCKGPGRLKMLRRDGWSLERQTGSHRQFKPGTVTVNGHEGDTLPHALVNSILKQARLNKEDLG